MPDRPDTFRAQTPQAFRFDTINKAYELAAADPGFHPTDDTRVVVDYLPDTPVAIVEGSETNLKITTQADMPIAEGIAAKLTGRPAAIAGDDTAKQEAKHACRVRRSRGRNAPSLRAPAVGEQHRTSGTRTLEYHAADQYRHLRFRPV